MHTIEDSVIVNFLVYTKSASFDYQWVYGLHDGSIQQDLQTYMLNWISTNQLAKLPTVTTFFRLRDYFALMVAQESKTRVDQEQRPIFQRAFFLWRQSDGLHYHHLEPLSLLLREAAEKVYAELPNNTVRLEAQTRELRLSITDLDKQTASLMDDYWDVPDGLTWQDVVREKLTVEVPALWDFRKMVSGLTEQLITPANMVYIGNALSFENRNPTEESWLVSAKGSTQSTEPRILNSEGRPLSLDELGKYKQRVNKRSREKTSPPTLSIGDGSNGFSSHEENPAQAAMKHDERERASTPPGSNNRALDGAAIEQFFSQYSEPDLYFNKTQRSELVRLLKKVLARDRSPLVEAETRLLVLLTPATLESYHDGNYSDVLVSWNNLLNEILIFYHQTSKGMPEEWDRRLAHLQEITMQNLSEPRTGWVDQFTDACHVLRKILTNI
jgi:hypothetical protein